MDMGELETNLPAQQNRRRLSPEGLARHLSVSGADVVKRDKINNKRN